MNKLFRNTTALLLLILISQLSSCKIGNFMDIDGNNYDNPLFVFALTDSGLNVYQTDTRSGSLFQKHSNPSFTFTDGACKVVYDYERKDLFISHMSGADNYITRFKVFEDGSLDTGGAYSYNIGAASIENYAFDNSGNYFYVLSAGNIYRFSYDGSGVINYLGMHATSYPSPCISLNIYNNNLLIHGNAQWVTFTINGDGTLTDNAGFDPVNPTTINTENPGPSITDNSPYLFKIASADVISYNVDPVGAGTVQRDNYSPVPWAAPANRNDLIRDKENNYLYFVHDSNSDIYCIEINNGIINNITTVPTAAITNAAAIDPYKQYFYTATSGQLNQHSMSGSIPDSNYSQIPTPIIYELTAVRYEH